MISFFVFLYLAVHTSLSRMPHPRKEAASTREKEKKAAARDEAARKAEEAKWADDDKARQARDARKAEKDKKADELLQKAREKAELMQQEEAANASLGKNKKAPPPKIKQSDIRLSALSAMSFENKKKPAVMSPTVVNDMPLEPNLNREQTDVEVGRGTTAQAVSAISAALGSGPIDAHPEKRQKALHAAYEERRMKELMIEKPNLKRAQYKDMIFREWLKSPENPMRQQP